MKTCILASGSKGNCLYISSNTTNILVDCGLSLSNSIKKLGEIGVNADSLDAILITHEHSDHAKGVGMLANKFNIPVYFYFDNFEKLNKASKGVKDELQKTFSLLPFSIGDILVEPFLLPHDSNKNLGYSFIIENKKVSVATDLGYMSADTLNQLKNSVIVYLEANHDENMLMRNDRYSSYLKQRILSEVGHLSNIDAARAIVELALCGAKQVVLCHLSEENNSPNLAYDTVKQILLENDIIEGKHIAIDVASQNTVGAVFELN